MQEALVHLTLRATALNITSAQQDCEGSSGNWIGLGQAYQELADDIPLWLRGLSWISGLYKVADVSMMQILQRSIRTSPSFEGCP